MTVSDWMIIVATLCGPILAVQAQKAIEAARESRGQKSWVFHQLMATRAARLSPQHVQALNTIDLTFYGRRRFRGRSEQEQSVLDRWKEYHDLLSDHGEREKDIAAWFSKGDELFVNLLEAIAKDVGYKFDRVQLRKGVYTPEAHNVLESEHNQLRKLVIETLNGDRPLRMDVVGFPVDEDALKAQTALSERLAEVVVDGEVKVRVSASARKANTRKANQGKQAPAED